jgi:predicted nucleic acid-binding protein
VSRLHSLDTNILPYSIRRHTAKASKQGPAIDLLERDDGALSVKVLQEFHVQATRPTRPDPPSHEIAAGLITIWTRFRVEEITLSI